MKWNNIDSLELLHDIKDLSFKVPVFIYKHSYRCSICTMTLNRIQSKWSEKDYDIATPYFIDVVKYRSISAEIATMFSIVHQSPQLLLVSKGECFYNSSHLSISYNAIMDNITHS